MEFKWNMFPRFNTLHLSEGVKLLQLRLNETPENFTGRIIFMSMFNDIQFSVLQVHCPEVGSKTKAMKIVDTLLCRFGDNSNCFSHNYRVFRLSRTLPKE